ncbi:S-layer homology domain-containing protein [Paenibacillus enshidis]|uniref:S-layer homology domain-containing protein n=1 Tax=Paenibacillus enshidis TaxID=1458439 RepID=A0ABV5AP95_9BACL
MRKVYKMMTVSAAAALISSALMGQSFAASSSFTDLNNISAKDKIISLQQRGIVSGVTSELFAPQTTLSAAQSVQLIVNAFGLNLDGIRFLVEPKATNYFSKADNNAWYANALITAGANGVPLDKDLDPQAQMTREAFTAELILAMEAHGKLPLIKPVVVEIQDQDQLNVEYSGAIQRGIAYGIIKLDADGSFHPKKNITRAEAAEEIYNAIEYLKAHPAPVINNESLSTTEGVQLIKDAFTSVYAPTDFNIDPNTKLTRESFTYLLVHSLQTSGKLPMIKLVPVEIKDNDQIELSYSGMIQTAIALEIVKLDADGNFNPKVELTRTDASDMISKALEAVKE